MRILIIAIIGLFAVPAYAVNETIRQEINEHVLIPCAKQSYRNAPAPAQELMSFDDFLNMMMKRPLETDDPAVQYGVDEAQPIVESTNIMMDALADTLASMGLSKMGRMETYPGFRDSY